MTPLCLPAAEIRWVPAWDGRKRLVAERKDLGVSLCWRPNLLEDRNEKKKRSLVSHIENVEDRSMPRRSQPAPRSFLVPF